MRVIRVSGLVCGVLLCGVATMAVAAQGDVYQGGSNFLSEKKVKANTSPILWSSMSVPPGIVEGVVFQIDCLIEAHKNDKGAPQKGVAGTVASFALQVDVGTSSWNFVGLKGEGIPFTTGKDGTVGISTGPVTAGSWANAPGSNDVLSMSATFTNAKRIRTTSLGCELVVPD